MMWDKFLYYQTGVYNEYGWDLNPDVETIHFLSDKLITERAAKNRYTYFPCLKCNKEIKVHFNFTPIDPENQVHKEVCAGCSQLFLVTRDNLRLGYIIALDHSIHTGPRYVFTGVIDG